MSDVGSQKDQYLYESDEQGNLYVFELDNDISDSRTYKIELIHLVCARGHIAVKSRLKTFEAENVIPLAAPTVERTLVLTVRT